MVECVSPKPIPGFWGKVRLSQEGSVQSWLPLVEHSRDVAATFRVLADLPTIQQRLTRAAGTTVDHIHLDRLAVLAFLHDLGKCNLGFQDKILNPRAPRVGHVRELGPLLERFADRSREALALDTLLSWFEPPAALEGFLVAAWSHHGRPVRYDPADESGDPARWWFPKGGRDPFQGILQLVQAARDTFPAAFSDGVPALPARPLLQHRFAGLVMLSDWMGSHEGFFPIERPQGFDAWCAAEHALQQVGLDSRSLQASLKSRPAKFAERFGSADPYPLQTAIDELPADGEQSRLLIAEAETGSGKTEAALARFFTLFAAGSVDGLYFALPTRVAAKQLYGRICACIERTFPERRDRPCVVLAVPGYARVDNVPLDQLLPAEEVRWQDDERFPRARGDRPYPIYGTCMFLQFPPRMQRAHPHH